MTRPRGSRTVLVVLLVALFGACSGDDADDSAGAPTAIADISAATDAGGTASVEGTRTGTGVSGPVTGAFAAEPPAGTLILPVFLAGGTVETAELRVVDGSLYVERVSVEPDAMRDLTAPDALAVRAAEELQWSRQPSAALDKVGNLALTGPFAVLHLLDEAGGELFAPSEDDGLVRYTIGPEAALVAYDIADARVWVDDDLRLQRLTVSTSTGDVSYDVTEYGIDVGVDVPAREVVVDLEPTAAGVDAAGEFTQTATGEHAGVTWTLERATGTDGGVCWRFASTPPLVANDGEVACTSRAEPDQPADLAVAFPYTTDGTGAADVIVAVATQTLDEAEFAFLDGTRAPAVASQFVNGTGAVVWVGPVAPTVGAATFTTADGTVVNCGPGGITAPEDLAGITADVLATQRVLAWEC